MPFIQRADASVYYELGGTGESIIFIHGMGLSHVNWRPQVDFFQEKGFQTITLDIRGHGRTTQLKENDRENIIQQITEDIYALYETLSLSSAFIFSYSTGTAIAQNFAQHYPSKVKGLVLSGAFPKISNLFLRGKFYSSLLLTFLGARKTLIRGVARSNGKNEEQIQLFQQEAQKVHQQDALRLLVDCLHFDCRASLKDLTMPILVTYGGNEKYMMKYRREYLQLAPNVEVCLIPHVNHATLTKSTALYNQVLLDFVQTCYS